MSMDAVGFHCDLRRLAKSSRLIQLADEKILACDWFTSQGPLRPISSTHYEPSAYVTIDITKVVNSVSIQNFNKS